jgi:hypothetical protein
MHGSNRFSGFGPKRLPSMDELFRDFQTHGIRYLLIGGQALRLAGMPRTTMDWDLFIPPKDEENFKRMNSLLESELDMPLVPLGSRGENFIQTYQTRWGVLQFHLGVPGVPRFDEAEKSAVNRQLAGGAIVRCLSGTQLLAAKQAANRPQDQDDILFLQELRRLGKLG